ncbi:sunset domain-containing protein [Flexivirga sp.]|uniref:sunset domain-containing protein n=1 Tax=Flexivirga sp. TaxID=1962927 RepID=UPI003F8012E5
MDFIPRLRHVKARRLLLLGTLTVGALTLAGCNAQQDVAAATPTQTVVRTVTHTRVVAAPTQRTTATHSPKPRRSSESRGTTQRTAAAAGSETSPPRSRQPVAAAPRTTSPRATSVPPRRRVAPLPIHTTTRRTPPPRATTTSTGACNIKGNISSSGERIYHVPGQRYYNVTKISPAKGERWFCSESDAVAAGWRKARV